MRVVLIAIMMALVAVPAHAQGSGMELAGQGERLGGRHQRDNADKKKDSAQEEKAYKDALKRIPNQKPADPWGKVR